MAEFKLAFTCTSLPLNLYTSVFGCGIGFGFEKNIGVPTAFGEKMVQIGGFAYPFSTPSFINGIYNIGRTDNESKWRKRKTNSSPLHTAAEPAVRAAVKN